MKKLVTGIAGLVVMVIIATSVLIPVITDSTNDTTTYGNSNILNYVTYSETPKAHTIDIKESSVEIDGDVYSTSTFYSVFSTSLFYISINGTSGNNALFSGWNETEMVSASIDYTASGNELKVTTSNGSATVELTSSGSTTTYTFAYTWEWVMSPSGDYAFATMGSTNYISSEAGVSFNRNYSSHFYQYNQGTVYQDGEVVSTPTTTLANLTEVVEGEVYSFSTITVNVSSGAAVNRAIVPVELIHYEPKTGAAYDLISIIPLVVFVGIVLGAIGMFISRRD